MARLSPTSVRRLDAITAVFAAVALPVAMVDAQLWVLLPLGLLVGVFVARTHSERIPVLVLLPLATVVVTLLNVDFHSEGAFFFVCIAAFRSAAELGGTPMMWAMATLAAASPLIASLANDPAVEAWNWPFWSMGIGISVSFGLVVFEQRRLAEALETAQQELAVQAVKDERRRLARDVHDLVGHGLTVVLLHLAGAKRLLERDRDTAIAAIDQAETTARHSLAEIRRTVGALRDDADSGRGGPVDLELDALLEQCRSAGLPVNHHHSGASLTALDAGTGLAVHRILQESLANAVRHGSGGAVDVVTSLSPSAVDVHVSNPAGANDRSTPGGGTGVIGMRERAEALGGQLRVGRADGRWTLDAHLPRREAAR